MRNVHVVLLVAGLGLLAPCVSAAQEPARQGSGSGSGSGGGSGAGASAGGGAGTSTYTVTTGDQEKPVAKPRVEPAMVEPPLGRWVRALTNVQVELTISDQAGAGAPEKKTVSMVVSSGSWGRIRSAQDRVDLNVDARPFVSIEGPIQLELTVVYSPPGAQSGDVVRVRPTSVNQSLTVILQSGKPLVVSQAADPIGDRKIIVEAKATVLK